MRIDLRPLLLLILPALFAGCTPRGVREPATLRLVYETARATRLSADRHALAPRIAGSAKTLQWKAEGATVTTTPAGVTNIIAAAGEFTLTASIPISPGVEYSLKVTATKAVTVEARATDEAEIGFSPANVNKRVDGFDYLVGVLAIAPTMEIRIRGKGDVTMQRIEVRESLLRQAIQLLSAEDAPLRAIVTQGLGTPENQERESLLAVGESAYEWPLTAGPARVLDFDTGVAPRHGADQGPIEAVIELHENGAWRRAFAVDRGAAGDNGEWRPAKVPLGGADALRLATHPRTNESVTLAWGRPVVRPAQRGPQPDILLVTLDALRADKLGPYGSTEGLSPNFDKLARDAVVFEEARATRAETWESVTSIAFATWSDDVGVVGRGDSTVHGARGIADTFAAAGYFTARIGNVSVLPGQLGTFDLSEDAAADTRALERLGQLLEDEKDRPKFIWIHLAATHYPYNIAKDYLPPNAPEKLDIKEFFKIVRDSGPPEAIAMLNARADAAVRQLDAQVSAFFPKLQDPARGGGPAVVVVTADHGSHRGEQGLWFMHGSFHRAVLRVPLIVSWPGHLSPRRVSPLVRTIDIGPTLMDLVDLPHDGYTGKSLVPLARGEAMPPLMNIVRDHNFVTLVENDRYKVIGGVNASKSWEQAQRTLSIPDLSLYRWREDPGELHDLSETEPLVAAELLSRVLRTDIEPQQNISPEAQRLLKQAGYAGDH